MLLRPPSRKGFTLLELIVVIVILGILAALAIPTFARVIERSEIQTAAASLSSSARNAQALRAFEPDKGFSFVEVNQAVSETGGAAYSAGVVAAGGFALADGSNAVQAGLESSFTDSRTYAEVGFALGGGGDEIGLAMQSKSGNCVYVKADASASTWSYSNDKLTVCESSAALGLDVNDPSGNPIDAEDPDTEEPGTGNPPATPTGVDASLIAYSDGSDPQWPYQGATSYVVTVPQGTAANASNAGVVFNCAVTPAFPAGVTPEYYVSENVDGTWFADVTANTSDLSERTFDCTITAFDANAEQLGSQRLVAKTGADKVGDPALLTGPAVEDITAAPGTDYVDVSFEDIKAPNGYEVVIKDPTRGGDDQYCNINDYNASPLTCRATGLTPGHEYEIVVTALFDLNYYTNESASSKPVPFTPRDMGSASITSLYDVAVDGNRMVAASGTASATKVFTWSGSGWVLQQELTPVDGSASARGFGSSVDIDGNTIAIGASGDSTVASAAGAVYVYNFDGSSWNQQQKITVPGSRADDRYGYEVDVDGSSLAFSSAQAYATAGASGASSANGMGVAYIYDRSGSSWTQQARLSTANLNAWPNYYPSQAFNSIALEDGVLAVGSANGGNSTGRVYIFSEDGSSWDGTPVVIAYEADENVASNVHTDAYGWFGYDVALDNGTLAVSAPLNDYGTTIYKKNSSGHWTEAAKITMPSGSTNMGLSIDLKDGVLLANGRTSTGVYAVYRFTESSDWSLASTQRDPSGRVLPNDGSTQRFGWSISQGDGLYVVGDRFSQNLSTF